MWLGDIGSYWCSVKNVWTCTVVDGFLWGFMGFDEGVPWIEGLRVQGH